MLEKPGKKFRVDLMMAMMFGAVAIAVGCSMMVGAAGGREPEVYDNPLGNGTAPTVVHVKAVTQLVRATIPLRD
jgi:hypothetical protein